MTGQGYLRHDDFVRPALRRPQLWRLVVGVLVALAVYLGVVFLIGVYVYLRHGQFVSAALVIAMTTGATPGGVLLMLVTFVGMALGPIVAVRLVQRRSAGTLFGAPAGTVASNFVRVALPVILLNIALLPLTTSGEGVARNLSLPAFLTCLPFALPLLLIQVSAEELVFRGYLQQQLAARFRSPAVWMVVPAALFAAGHFAPQQFQGFAWPIVVWAAVFGLLAADLTARTGNLGAAMGLHFATNVSAILLVGLKGNLGGLALWTIAIDFSDPAAVAPLLLADFAAMIVAWLVARLVLRV